MEAEEISAVLKTSVFRGDHATDVAISIAIEPNMTVMQLMKRVFKEHGIKTGNTTLIPDKFHDHIEIRFQHKV